MELLIYIAKSAGILTLFYLVYRFVLQKDTFFTSNRTFLLVGIVASLLLPLVTFTSVVVVEAPVLKASENLIEIPDTSTVTHATAQEATDYGELLMWGYLLGLLVMAIRFLGQLISVFRLLRKYPSQKKNGYRFVEIEENTAPFSFFNYIAYNPNTHERDALEMILKHEKVHAAQWHSVDLLLSNVLRALQWINPFSWLYKKHVEENLEFLADYHSAHQMTSTKEYQLALLRESSQLPVPALTNNFYQSITRLSFFGREFKIEFQSGQVKKRIIMLNKQSSNKYNRLKILLILPALALFLWSFNSEIVIEYAAPPVAETTSTYETPNSNFEESSNKTTVVAENETASENYHNDTSKTEATGVSDNMVKPQPHQNITSQTRENNALKTKAVARVIKTPNPNKESGIKTKKETASFSSAKEIRIKITKNTTKEELDRFKKELKEMHNIDFNYSNINYNSAGEMTSISINYSGKGNNGNYSIATDDEEPIEDFYFYMDTEKGRSGFSSTGTEEQLAKRRAMMEERKRLRGEAMEERRELLEEKREVLRGMAEVNRSEMMEERKEVLARTREEMKRERKVLREELAAVREATRDARDRARATYHYNTHLNHEGEKIVITANTSDEELEMIKDEVAERGVNFNYRRIKRNSKGEITSIKATFNNGKGHNVSKVIQSDDDEPIQPIVVNM